jgi:acetyl-CoA carboxylase carboxyltransferase component
MFVTGPKVVKTVTGEDVTVEELGGATMHATKSGVAQLVAENEEEGIKTIKRLLSFLPSNNMESPPEIEPTDPIERVDNALNEIIPDSPKTPYDMKRVINSIIDNEDFLEILPDYAKNIIVGFARMGGMPVGIVADQPLHLAGVLDINASRKGARFVRFCDAFNIPLITLVDVPGFLPGTGQEYGGLILHGAKLLYAYGEATVPRLTVILRKNYGGAYCVMSSKHMRGDINYAWPTAEIAVMGGKGAIEILMSKEIKKIEDADKLAEFMDTKEAEYREQFANPYVAAKYGYLDDIIEPRNTRYRLIKALKSLQSKRLENPPKKHDNLPL